MKVVITQTNGALLSPQGTNPTAVKSLKKQAPNPKAKRFIVVKYAIKSLKPKKYRKPVPLKMQNR